MITFQLFYNSNMETIEYDDDNLKIIDIKNEIIKRFNLKSNYIDLDFKNESTIRGIGKLNLEKGLLLRLYDDYKLNRWNVENKTLIFNVTEVNDYKYEKREPIIKKNNNNDLYRSPSKLTDIKSGETYITNKPSFNLDSIDDFPSLK